MTQSIVHSSARCNGRANCCGRLSITGDTAVYKGTLGATDTNFIAFADYAAAPTGAQYDDDPVWSGVEANISIADKEADIAGEGNLESDQYRYTRNVATTVKVTDPGDPSFTEIYDTHTGDADVYDWGGGSLLS